MKVFIVSENCPAPVSNLLHSLGKVYYLKANNMLLEAESCHPDMQIFATGVSSFIYAPNIDNGLISDLKSIGIKAIRGSADISPKYPQNVAYNALKTAFGVICNKEHVSKEISEFGLNKGLIIQDCKQGYCACTSLYIDFINTVITADISIKKSAEKLGHKVFLLKEDTGIHLEGMSMGFIGGCSGTWNNGRNVIFSGRVDLLLPELYDFLLENNVKVYMPDCEMTDIGGIQVFTI